MTCSLSLTSVGVSESPRQNGAVLRLAATAVILTTCPSSPAAARPVCGAAGRRKPMRRSTVHAAAVGGRASAGLHDACVDELLNLGHDVWVLQVPLCARWVCLQVVQHLRSKALSKAELQLTTGLSWAWCPGRSRGQHRSCAQHNPVLRGRSAQRICKLATRLEAQQTVFHVASVVRRRASAHLAHDGVCQDALHLGVLHAPRLPRLDVLLCALSPVELQPSCLSASFCGGKQMQLARPTEAAYLRASL